MDAIELEEIWRQKEVRVRRGSERRHASGAREEDYSVSNLFFIFWYFLFIFCFRV